MSVAPPNRLSSPPSGRSGAPHLLAVVFLATPAGPEGRAVHMRLGAAAELLHKNTLLFRAICRGPGTEAEYGMRRSDQHSLITAVLGCHAAVFAVIDPFLHRQRH
jgi:hypothetical protein